MTKIRLECSRIPTDHKSVVFKGHRKLAYIEMDLAGYHDGEVKDGNSGHSGDVEESSSAFKE